MLKKNLFTLTFKKIYIIMPGEKAQLATVLK